MSGVLHRLCGQLEPFGPDLVRAPHMAIGCLPTRPIHEPGMGMPKSSKLEPMAEWLQIESAAADWDHVGKRRTAPDALPPASDPRVRGGGARSQQRWAGARASPFQYRPGGRGGGLDRAIACFRPGQRAASRPPPVPGQGAGLCRPAGLQSPEAAAARADPRGAAPHPGRDHGSGRRLLQRSRRLDASSLGRGRGARHQCHRRRRRALRQRRRPGRRSARARATWSSPISAMAG